MTRIPVTSTPATWTNWAGTVSAEPTRVAVPADASEVAALVRDGLDRGERWRPVGSGHSFTAIAAPAGGMLDLRRLSGIQGVDPATGHVRIGAGTPLHRIGPGLHSLGLGMQNLGDIDRQTIAGATSTGTHGTGLGFGNIATQIVGLELVTGLGEIIRIDAEHRPELLPAAAIGLGALGVLTELTIACVPEFVLDTDERTEPRGLVVDGFEDRLEASDHFEFYWFPHTDVVFTKTQQRLPGDAERRPAGIVTRVVNDELLGNGIFELLCRAGQLSPRFVPSINRLCARTMGARHSSDYAPRILTTRRRVRFREMEYALPLAAMAPAFRAVGDLIERKGWTIEFPLEVRGVAGDELWLSPNHGRDTAHIAIHRYHRAAPDEYFFEAERIFLDHGGRPHWGKMHSLGRAQLEPLYPRLVDFLAVRDELDPHRVFANPYLEKVLGP